MLQTGGEGGVVTQTRLLVTLRRRLLRMLAQLAKWLATAFISMSVHGNFEFPPV